VGRLAEALEVQAHPGLRGDERQADVAGTEERQPYAAVICATGYQRATVPAILDPVRPYMDGATADRHYRLPLVSAEPRVSLHPQITAA
jgi:L-ornithine N5-oxygenase